jgi:hypothetical protein
VSWPFGAWETGLVAVVSAQTLAIAYLRHPEWKALVYGLPFPFTFATMVVGRRVDASHVLGLILLMAYVHAVRLLHRRAGWPITLAIATGAALYVGGGAALAPRLSTGDGAFAAAAAAALLVGGLGVWLLPRRAEPGHRTTLPVWLKLPLVVAVVTGLVLAKQELRGTMTTFPLVGVLAAYEARHSLATLCRQTAKFVLMAVALMAASRWAEPAVGLGLSLGLGWLVFLLLFLPVFHRARRRMVGAPSPAVP